MTSEDMQFLQRLLKKWLQTNGDLPDKRVEKTRQLVLETIDDSEPEDADRKAKDW